MAYAIVALKNICYDLKSLFLKMQKRRINERFNKNKNFNLNWGTKKSIALDKNKILTNQNLNSWLHKIHDAIRATIIKVLK